MCGIAGKLTPGRAIDPALLRSMCDAITHRGPDSDGYFTDAGLGMGIRRLAVIDLRTGDQPIRNEDGSVAVVLNGEIYNYRELREELRARGHTFATSGDTETIVHAYEEYGDDCVDHLRGMFAFALWDRRRGRLLLARDRVGKKPLFYAEAPGALWFASEPRSILQDPDAPREPNLAAIDLFLRYQYVPDPHSAFAGFHKLPPGHRMTVERDGTRRIERYWKLSYADKLTFTDEREAQELVREKLLEATRIRLRSDVPLGAFLSGGVDSSAVVAAMAHSTDATLRTFSIGFDVGGYDEREYARQVAELYSTEHEELVVEPDVAELLPRLVWHYGEPFADQSAVPSFYLSEMTRRSVTVALNGDGGDESFAGYSRYRGMAMVERFERLPGSLRRLSRGAARALGPGSEMDSFRSRLLRLTTALNREPADRYGHWIAVLPDERRAGLYGRDLRAAADDELARGVIRDPYLASDAENIVDRLLDVDVQTWLAGQLLVKMDIASMAHSLEVRSPMLDHEFMEMAARLPAELKLRGSDTKAVLKDAIRDTWIPGSVFDRPKRGFTMPIGPWLRGPLRPLAEDVLLDDSATARGLFEPAGVRALIDDHVNGASDNANAIWSLMQLELWFRTYIDRRPAGPETVGAVTAAAA